MRPRNRSIVRYFCFLTGAGSTAGERFLHVRVYESTGAMTAERLPVRICWKPEP